MTGDHRMMIEYRMMIGYRMMIDAWLTDNSWLMTGRLLIDAWLTDWLKIDIHMYIYICVYRLCMSRHQLGARTREPPHSMFWASGTKQCPIKVQVSIVVLCVIGHDLFNVWWYWKQPIDLHTCMWYAVSISACVYTSTIYCFWKCVSEVCPYLPRPLEQVC